MSTDVLTFFVESYVQPFTANPLTVNLTDVAFLPSVELVTLQAPVELVMQLVAPDPADQAPTTEAPAIGPAESATPIVTVAVQPFRRDAAEPARLPTHITLVTGAALTVTVELADAVAPPLSVTVNPTV